MDLEYNNKLKAIMKRHNTETWNADCANDPEYKKLSGIADFSENGKGNYTPLRGSNYTHPKKKRKKK